MGTKSVMEGELSVGTKSVMEGELSVGTIDGLLLKGNC